MMWGITKSIENHLQQVTYFSHFDVWLSHWLSEKIKKILDHIFMCNLLFKCNKNVLFFK